MNRKYLGWVVLAAICSNSVYAQGDWRFPLALTYISGFEDIVDIHEENLEAEGYIVETSDFTSIGISFQPYFEFDSGFRLGMGIGPMSRISGGTDFFDLPININVGYTLLPQKSISPYIRGGVMYHVVEGDYVESATPGLFAAIGIEFARQNAVSFGFEISYDTSTIDIQKKSPYASYYYGYSYYTTEIEEIEPYGLMISGFIVF